MHPWQQWYNETRRALAAIPQDPDEANSVFLNHYYRQNQPVLMPIPEWKALDWTIPLLQEKVGNATIQFQIGRAKDVDYELQAELHKIMGTFDVFVDFMQTGPENDVYITAGNQYVNRAALQPLYEDIGPLPPFLRQNPTEGFFWIGNATVTPMHHDLTNNLMCQVMGNKLVRCVHPKYFDKMKHKTGVHSSIGWMTETYAKEHGIDYIDFWLRPGYALFLPVGWWHQVKTSGVAITVVYTNFLWNNNFHANFRC